MNLILETTTGTLVPAGSAPPLPRGGAQPLVLQFVTAGIAALLANNAPIAFKVYSAADLETPLATIDAWTKDAVALLYTSTIDTVAGAFASLGKATLFAKISYGAVNVDSALFLINYGSGAAAGAPAPQIVIREVSTGGGGGGGVGALVQLVGTFGGRVAVDQVEGYLAVLAAAEIPSVILTAQDAPTGSALLVELIKNGVATGKVATLAAGAKNQETAFGAALAVAEGDVLQFKPTQVGSTKSGTNLVVQATMRGV